MRAENVMPFGANTICWAMCLLTVPLANAADLPDRPGKAETARLCGKCHPIEQAISMRQGEQAWKETLSKMFNLGAEGSDAEFASILTYLTKNFGSAAGN